MPPTSPWKQRLLGALAANQATDELFGAVELATNGVDGWPRVRMVMIRGLAGDTNAQGAKVRPALAGELLRFTTDWRNEKCRELVRDARVEACWWFSKTKEQFRLRGHAHLLREDGWVACEGVSATELPPTLAHAATEEWHAYWTHLLPVVHHRHWAGISPGELLDEHGGDPIESADEIEEAARRNFVVGVLAVTQVDWVQLNEREGNRREKMWRGPNGEWLVKAVRP